MRPRRLVRIFSAVARHTGRNVIGNDNNFPESVTDCMCDEPSVYNVLPIHPLVSTLCSPSLPQHRPLFTQAKT